MVQGVNDEPAAEPAGGDDGAPQSYPLSPTALADQQSREARYGTPAVAADPGRRVASAESSADAPAKPGVRPHAFDASEGTPLDPLLNKT